MKREKIDIENWGRKELYEFFKDFANPTVGITAEIECENGYRYARENNKSFFLVYSYAILRSINEIPEFRYRIEQSPQEAEPAVYKYSLINLSSPIKVNKSGKYIQKNIDYNPDFETFHCGAKEEIAKVEESDVIFEQKSAQGGIVSLSAVPDLHFTGISYTLRYEKGVNFLPLVTVGKMVEREGRKVIPIAISIHHGLVDGHHVTEFFKRVESILREF
ncbi:MAG: CatA-like O-acetyltransferase [Rikenellaceae bacterium]